MSISFTCPSCGQQLRVKDSRAGKTGRCASCGEKIAIPTIVANQEPVEPMAQVAVPWSPEDGAEQIDLKAHKLGRKLEIESHSRASNPGRFSPNWWHLIKNHYANIIPLQAVLLWLAGSALGAVFVFFGNVPVGFLCFAVPLGLIVVNCHESMRYLRDICASGNTNPGIVLCVDKQLVAVLVNLTLGGPDYLAIKIVKQKLRHMLGAPFVNGDRLTAVTYYYRGEGDEQWKDVWLTATNSLTNDSRVIQRLLWTIDESDWSILESAAPQFQSQPAGTYPLTVQIS